MAVIGINPSSRRPQAERQKQDPFDRDLGRVLKGLQVASAGLQIMNALTTSEEEQLKIDTQKAQLAAIPTPEQVAAKSSQDLATQGVQNLKTIKEIEMMGQPKTPEEAQTIELKLNKLKADTKKSEIGAKEAQEKYDKEQAQVISNSKQTDDPVLGGKLGKIQSMGAEQKKRFDNVSMAYNAIQKMKSGLASGEFVGRPSSFVGDNEYTLGSKLFSEALGRMQSGGAITADEDVKFNSLVPGLSDVMFGDPDAKLIEMENEMLRRAQSFGMSREDLDGYLQIGQTEAAPPADLKNLDSNQKLGIFRQLNKKAPQ